jgi:hypothetical protein
MPLCPTSLINIDQRNPHTLQRARRVPPRDRTKWDDAVRLLTIDSTPQHAHILTITGCGFARASVAKRPVALPRPSQGAQSMTNFPFPSRADASAFAPDSVRILSDALEDAWQSLHTAGTTFHFDGHAELTCETLARCIIELAKLGERGPSPATRRGPHSPCRGKYPESPQLTPRSVAACLGAQHPAAYAPRAFRPRCTDF